MSRYTPTMASLVKKMNELMEWPDAGGEMAALAVEMQQLVADGGDEA